MSSNLKVNTILPSTGTNVAIGTAGGSITMVGNVDIDINSGISTFNDIHISDKIVHDGDTNTSLRFPAADTITAETGGLERLRIDSSGRALIGTTTEGHAEGDDLTIATSGVTGITIRSGTSSAGNIFFSDATSGSAERQGILRYDHADDAMKFNVNNAERFRIDSSGRLIQRYSAAPYDNRAATFQAPAGETSTYIAVVNTETNGASGILFGDHVGQNSGNFDAYINYSHQYQHMQFLVGSGTEIAAAFAAYLYPYPKA